MSNNIEKCISELEEKKAALIKQIDEIAEAVNVLRKLFGQPQCSPAPAPRIKRERGNKSSKYYGVSLNKITNKYVASVWYQKTTKSLGSFIEEVAAAKAVDDFLVSKGLPKRNFQ